MAVEVRIRTEQQLERLGEVVDDPSPALDWIGVTLRTQSERAFSEGGFDGQRWPEQYPGMSEPFIHVAGAMTDLQGGPAVKKRRLSRISPAGRDSGRLATSIEYAVAGDSVAVGSSLPYATDFHSGGTSVIRVTPALRRNLFSWLRKRQGRPYRAKLGFLFSVDEVETDQAARPFVGMTTRTFGLLTRNLEIWLKRRIEDG